MSDSISPTLLKRIGVQLIHRSMTVFSIKDGCCHPGREYLQSGTVPSKDKRLWEHLCTELHRPFPLKTSANQTALTGKPKHTRVIRRKKEPPKPKPKPLPAGVKGWGYSLNWLPICSCYGVWAVVEFYFLSITVLWCLNSKCEGHALCGAIKESLRASQCQSQKHFLFCSEDVCLDCMVS